MNRKALPAAVPAYLKAVAWSFIGIRRGAGARDDLGRLRPLPLILTGVLLAAGFVGTLMLLARLAVARLGA